MNAVMEKMVKKSFLHPEEVRNFEKGKIELVTAGDTTFGRATLQPGWKWSECVKPIAQTESCEASHVTYHVAGRLRIVMDDGTANEFGPGDVSVIPPGHDAWVVGDETVILIDISGLRGLRQEGGIKIRWQIQSVRAVAEVIHVLAAAPF